MVKGLDKYILTIKYNLSFFFFFFFFFFSFYYPPPPFLFFPDHFYLHLAIISPCHLKDLTVCKTKDEYLIKSVLDYNSWNCKQ